MAQAIRIVADLPGFSVGMALQIVVGCDIEEFKR
jgi:hypothetical protein